jgi:putative component of membrane protein insertase Oxa1/YidC/SpoIIIJ protein YidD
MTRFRMILLVLFACSSLAYSQQEAEPIKTNILRQAFAPYIYTSAPKRKLLTLKGKSFAARINPVNYFAAGMLFFYQRIVSEQIQANCNYVLSCSEFTKLSIQKKGFVSGFLTGMDQLMNCSSAIRLDYPDYKITLEQKVINTEEDE